MSIPLEFSQAQIIRALYEYSERRGYKVESSRPGWFVCGFEVTDTRGMLHRTASCCSPKETVAEIESFWRDLEVVDDGLPSFKTVIQDRLRQGLPICDEDGVMLPDCVT